MSKYSTVIIGGGASGILAAISARHKNGSPLICERMPALGKKILASGNGRCNLLNDDLSDSHYNISARSLVKSVFAKFGKNDILDFFKKLGLNVYSDSGRVFPVTNQASSVFKVLDMELRRLSIPAELNFEVTGISVSKDGFTVRSKDGKRVMSSSVIIAAGGKSYPFLGSDGSLYALAESFGHKIVKPVPSAVALVVKDRLCHILQGQRISASITGVVNGKDCARAEGDILFTKYGLSGTAVLDMSRELSIAINRARSKDVWVSLDLMPFMSCEILAGELSRRRGLGVSEDDILIGILPNKFSPAFKGLTRGMDPGRMATLLKGMRFQVAGTRGWNEAEFTCGGIDTSTVMEGTLESKSKKGLYFAGEILDVDGERGGYNLAWAWASGYVAGMTE